MPMFPVPRWWWIGVLVGLCFIAVGAALGAVEQGMRERQALDGCGAYFGEPDTEDADSQACRDGRVRITVVDAVTRATLGPGIAVVVLGAVYLVATAIASRRPKHREAS